MMNELEYIDETHTYLWEGVIIPSVSEILHYIFPNKYDGVDPIILANKASYGTKIHELVELIEKNKTLPKMGFIEEFSMVEYLRLKSKHKIEVIEQEQMICYKGLYAGRFDMLADVEGHFSLCDIKTTATLDLDYLSWQLSYYNLALEYMYPSLKVERLYAIWLPKKKSGKVVVIEKKNREELLKKLKEYYDTIRGSN